VEKRARFLFGILIIAVVAGLAYRAWGLWWLCDDAFISFRYARNLAEGRGLVFNVGERVEGYTNFLWVLELAAIWRVTGVQPETASLVLSVLCTGLLLLIVAWMAFRQRSWGSVVAVLVLLAANRSFAVWVTSGLETRQFSLFVLAAVALLGSPRAASAGVDTRGLIAASFMLAACELTRPEGSLIFVACFACYVLYQWMARRLSFRGILALGVPFTVLVGAHYLWRRGYYHDWLPNTYYAKHVRAWRESGDHYFTAAALEHGLYLLVPLGLFGLVHRLRRQDPTHLFSAAILVPHALYVRDIGGDHFEFRPLDFYWPLLSLAAVDGLFALASWLSLRVRSYRTALRSGLILVGLGLLLEYGTVLQRAHERLTADRTTRGTAYKLYAPVTAENFPEAFYLPGLQRFIEKYNQSSWFCVDHQSCTRRGEHRAYWELLDREFGPYRAFDEVGRDALPASAVWAREAVGVGPYYLPMVTVIDLYGLTDAVIARTPVERTNAERTMAHDRHPPPGYLEARGRNIDIGPAVRSEGEALRAAYWAFRVREDVWMPFLSPDGDWVIGAFQGKSLFSQLHFDPVHVEDNMGWMEGRMYHGKSFVGRFDEDPLDGWGISEGLIAAPDTSAVPSDFYQVGRSWLSTRTRALGEEARSVVASRPFQAEGRLVFLMAGGGDEERAGISLMFGDKVVKAWFGRGAQRLEMVSFDLSAFAGQTGVIQVIDRSERVGVEVDQVMVMR